MNHFINNPFFLKAAAIACFALAVATLFPFTFSQDTSILGYYAICPFSPVSTGILLHLGIMSNNYSKKRRLI